MQIKTFMSLHITLLGEPLNVLRFRYNTTYLLKVERYVKDFILPIEEHLDL